MVSSFQILLCIILYWHQGSPQKKNLRHSAWKKFYMCMHFVK